MFTVTVLDSSSEGGIDPPHPDARHQHKLVEVWRRLPASHGLAYCGGCEWFLRWPKRTHHEPGSPSLGEFAHTHLVSAHFDALLAGQAVIDPDLHDGGAEYLRQRMAAAVRT